jgi:hypothetical protein
VYEPISVEIDRAHSEGTYRSAGRMLLSAITFLFRRAMCEAGRMNGR